MYTCTVPLCDGHTYKSNRQSHFQSQQSPQIRLKATGRDGILLMIRTGSGCGFITIGSWCILACFALRIQSLVFVFLQLKVVAGHSLLGLTRDSGLEIRGRISKCTCWSNKNVEQGILT